MKYILKNMFLITISAIFITCDKEYVNDKDNFNLLSMEEIQMFGIQHSEALDYMLEGLKLNRASSLESSEQMEMLINQELGVFYEKLFSSSQEILVVNDYSRNEVSKHFNRAKTKNYTQLSDISPIEITIEENDGSLSLEQIRLLRELDLALASNNSNIVETLAKPENIQLKATFLPEIEAQIILIGVEIGISSLSYWNENLGEWEKVLNGSNNSGRVEGWFSASEVVGADVAGAVGGAVAALAINLIPGPGQVAYGAAIIGGAVGASVADAVLQVWNHFF